MYKSGVWIVDYRRIEDIPIRIIVDDSRLRPRLAPVRRPPQDELSVRRRVADDALVVEEEQVAALCLDELGDGAVVRRRLRYAGRCWPKVSACHDELLYSLEGRLSFLLPGPLHDISPHCIYPRNVQRETPNARRYRLCISTISRNSPFSRDRSSW